ncbi:MAG: sigma 54-interacting response regulator [Ferruginibacter sp.]
MNKKILIVEDQFVEANDLRLMLEKAGYQVSDIARSVQQGEEIIGREKPGLVLLDIFLKGKLTGIDFAKQLKEENIPFVYLSANSNEEVLAKAKATEPYGFLLKPFREKDVLVAIEIARYLHAHSTESRYRREAALQGQLAAILTDSSNWEKKLLKTGSILQQDIPFDFFAAGFNNIGRAGCGSLGFLRLGFDEYQAIGLPGLLTVAGITMDKLMWLHANTIIDKEATIYGGPVFEDICEKPSLKKMFADTFHLKSHLALPLHLERGEMFSFCFYSRRPDAYRPEHINLFHRLHYNLAKSIEKMLISEKINGGLSSVKTESANTQELAPTVSGFEGIIGSSHLLLNVFDHVMQVAPTDTSVLIMGESGTGKERIADCIHRLSPRMGKPFVKVNCAGLPATLIETELFGHEKGAFTGATEKRIGKFEQADMGTIFLDEIGEMPVELQVKLLRVLQEKEIERIGSRAPTKINVRIIAATNRNLEKEVAEGRFRLDLYYRLNIFPILLPPLRLRKEDIPVLVSHFISCYNRKAGKKITGISDKAMKNLMGYDWPGNIRELEHLLERSVLLAKGPVIEDMALPGTHKKEVQTEVETRITKTIFENERDHILGVLKKCNGRIWGAGGAAELLGVPPTTLTSKMKKLGIRREFTE